MVSASLSHLLLALIVAVSILLMLIRPRDIPEVYWVGGGAILLIALRLIPLQTGGKGGGRGLRCLSFSHRHDAAVGIGP